MIDKSTARFQVILCGVCFDDEFETVKKKAVCKNCGSIDKTIITTNMDIKEALAIKERTENLLKQYDHDYKLLEINDEKIKKAQNELGFKQSYDHTHNFAILKVAYTRKELQKLITGVT